MVNGTRNCDKKSLQKLFLSNILIIYHYYYTNKLIVSRNSFKKK